MHELQPIGNVHKPEFYRELALQLESLLEGETDPVANAANTAALLFHAMTDVNWAGFYFLGENDELVVGPFQGRPACVRIAKGQGVCGAAVARREPVLVEDVHAFAGHVVCDPDSRSELVMPLISGDRLIGVLDLDSPRVSRFDSEDLRGIQHVASIFVAASYGT
jgi:L-methionine (R)-S-oxide reductase